MMRDDFSQKTKDILAKRVGYHCSNPDCRHMTIGPGKTATDVTKIGVASHICAASHGGPRFDASMTPKERKSIENGIWLCQNCARLIDTDTVRYTVELLNDWKRAAELQAQKGVSSSVPASSAMVASTNADGQYGLTLTQVENCLKSHTVTDRVTHSAMAEDTDGLFSYLAGEDLWVDGYHEVYDKDGNVIEKGQYLNGKLVDGISYNIILKISKQKNCSEEPEPTEEEAEEFDGYDYECWKIRNTEEPVAPEDIKKEEWSYSDFGRYDLPFALLRSNRYIKGIGLEYFYVVDKKVKLEGKLIKPIFTNFRTFESVMAEKDPDELDYIKTGIRKYDEAESAEIEID